MSESLGRQLADTLRAAAHAYAAGDQVAPCAVLWADPERLWEEVMPQLQALVPELYVLGEYAPDKRIGPALWLRCIEARGVDGAPPLGTTPIFYLPGISREKLRAAELASMSSPSNCVHSTVPRAVPVSASGCSSLSVHRFSKKASKAV